MHKIVINILYISLLFLSPFSCTQVIESESEKTKLSINDSIEFSRLIDSLSGNYSHNNDSLIEFSNTILLKFPEIKADANIKIAHIHFSKGNYYLAEHYFSNAAENFLQDSLKEQYAEQISNIGVVREVSGSYPDALKKYFEALSVFLELDLKLKCSKVYNNIGIVYQQLKENEKSLEYYKKSLKISEELGRDDISAKRYNNIATHFEEFGSNLDSALFYYEKAYVIFDRDSTVNLIPIVINNIGNIYLQKNDFDKADSLFNKALLFCTEKGIINTVSPILINQANLLLEKKNYSSAIIKATKALILTRKNGNKESESDVLRILKNAYRLQGKYEEAYNFSEESQNILEELRGVEQKKQINSLAVQYKVREKDNQIEILELKNHIQLRELWQVWSFAIVLFFLLVLLFFFFQLQKKNNKYKIAQMHRDIADYISQIEEVSEKKEKIIENKEVEMLKKIKQFKLTEREEDVLILISEGYKNNEISEKMFVSVNTIKTHIKNIFIKLEVRNRMEAAKKAQVL